MDLLFRRMRHTAVNSLRRHLTFITNEMLMCEPNPTDRFVSAFMARRRSSDGISHWVENLPVLWAASPLIERLRVTFLEPVAKMDLRKVLPALIAPPFLFVPGDYRACGLTYSENKDTLCFEMRGRRITIAADELALYVSGSDDNRPDSDNGLQDLFLHAVTEVFAPFIDFVGTERWTDTPFEEPPERKYRGEDAAVLLKDLTRANARLRFEVDYFLEDESKNPEIDIEFFKDEKKIQSLAARGRWSHVIRRIAPGDYWVRAVAAMYSMPWWKASLGTQEHSRYFRTPVWYSPSVWVSLAPNVEHVFAVGVPREQRKLSAQEQYLFMNSPLSEPVEPRMILYFENRSKRSV